MKRLLLVEDDPSIRRYVALALEDEGLDTLDEAGTLQSALACLRERSYDLVLTDWKMPGMNGVDATRLIKSDTSLAKMPAVVMVTAFGLEEVRTAAEQARADGFLVKPVHQSALVDGLLEIF